MGTDVLQIIRFKVNELAALFAFQMKMIAVCIAVSSCILETGCGLVTQKKFLYDAFRNKLFQPPVNRSDSYGTVFAGKIGTDIIYGKMPALRRFQVGDK